MPQDSPAGDPVRLEFEDGLAVFTLTQAARGNPFDGAFTRGVKQAVGTLCDTPGLRAVLIRAEGPNFSVGGDLKSFYPMRDALPPTVREWTADLHMGLQRLWKLPVPIVCAVQGFAMGGGVALLAGCDIVFAASSAKLGSAFAQLGFSCDSGSSTVMAQRMGVARARRFVLMAEVLSAQEAQAAGLVDRVVDDGALQDEALVQARKLAQGPTLAYGEIKRLFAKAASTPIEAQLEDEAQTLARVSGSADAQEGIAALVEKRKPAFRGR